MVRNAGGASRGSWHTSCTPKELHIGNQNEMSVAESLPFSASVVALSAALSAGCSFFAVVGGAGT